MKTLCTKLLTMAIAIPLILASCSDDPDVVINPPIPDPDPDPEVLDYVLVEKINAALSPISTATDPHTRAIYDPEYMPLLWSGSDKLGLYYSYTTEDEKQVNYFSNVEFAIGAAFDGKTYAELIPEDSIKMPKDAGKHTFYGYYPYDEYLQEDITEVFNIPALQPQTSENIFDGKVEKLLAKVEFDEAMEEVDIEFAVPYSILNIKLDPTASGLGYQFIEFFNIESERLLAGDAQFNLNTGKYEAVEGEDYNSYNLVSVTLPKRTGLYEPIETKVVILPGDYTEDKLLLRFVTDFTVINIDITPDYEIKPGRIYDMDVNVIKYYERGKLTEDRLLSMNPDESNCHIVSPGSSVEIPVNRAYWVWRTLFSSEPTADASISAHLVWQDTQSLITDITLSGTGDAAKINVNTAAGLSGNAVVALYNGPDVMWSWHIWVTDYNPASEGYRYDSSLGYNYTVMGRNLGALNNNPSDVDAYGLFYQWGRHTPFPGAAAEDPMMTGFTTRPIYSMDNSIVSITNLRVSAVENLQFGIQRPTEYYYSTYNISEGDLNVDWYSWDLDIHNDFLWGEQNYKSVFDPCPKGWHVPFCKGGQSHWKNDGSGAWSISLPSGGLTTSYGEYYPAAGLKGYNYVQNPSGSLEQASSGVMGTYWTGSSAAGWIAGATSGSGMVMNFMNFMDYFVTYSAEAFAGKASALSVRCVKEELF